jgi:hypothetical protein
MIPNDKNNKIKIQFFIIIIIILFQSMDKEGFSPNRDRRRDYLMIQIFIVSLLRILICFLSYRKSRQWDAM